MKKYWYRSVLESSPKTVPSGNVEDDIAIFSSPNGQSNIVIMVVVIRVGFPKPSSHSR
jgi:hypothetical protein